MCLVGRSTLLYSTVPLGWNDLPNRQNWGLQGWEWGGKPLPSITTPLLKSVVLRCWVHSGDIEVREQRDEHSSVHLCASSILAAQLPRRLYLVAAVRRRKRFVVDFNRPIHLICLITLFGLLFGLNRIRTEYSVQQLDWRTNTNQSTNKRTKTHKHKTSKRLFCVYVFLFVCSLIDLCLSRLQSIAVLNTLFGPNSRPNSVILIFGRIVPQKLHWIRIITYLLDRQCILNFVCQCQTLHHILYHFCTKCKLKILTLNNTFGSVRIWPINWVDYSYSAEYRNTLFGAALL